MRLTSASLGLSWLAVVGLAYLFTLDGRPLAAVLVIVLPGYLLWDRIRQDEQ